MNNKANLSVIVLAGGFGTRLKSITNDMPKPLVPIQNHVFLDIVLAQVLKNNPDHIILCLHFNVEAFEDYLRKREFPVKVSIVVENEPLGTGGAIKNAFDAFPDMTEAAVINSDTLSKLDLRKMFDKFNQNDAMALMGLSEVPDRSRYGSITLDGDIITSFSEKTDNSAGLINNGSYILSRKIFDGMDGTFSIEQDVFKNLIKSSKLFGYKVKDDDFFDIGTPEDYLKLAQHFRNSYYDTSL